jgi:tetratricopeptide (TPR) repeat protein
LQPRIALVGMLVQAGFPDKALRLIEDIRNEPRKTPMPAHTLMTLIQSEAWAHVYKDDLATAENILRAAETKYPGDDTPFSTLIEIYFRINQKAKAEALLQHELTRNADNASALINSAVIKIQRQEYAPAIEMLDRALKAEPNNAYALINRAISNLQLNRLEEAQRDYELILNKQSKVPHSIYYGLGEIAWRKRLPKTALKHYSEYLKIAPRGTAEYEDIEQRVKKLKAGSLEFRPRNA